METMLQAVGRLSEQGYTDQCRTEAQGVRFLDDGAVFAPEDVLVEDVVRLEGSSAPEEEAVVFAVCSPQGARRGTLCVSYGHGMDVVDSDIVRRLIVRPLH